jgi:7-carboxy-7-deazaguanine synthase
VFIRTTGCHLRCSYCDTEHAFFAGNELSVDEIMARVMEFGIDVVEITGGEPLLQTPVLELFDRLLEKQMTVLLETSGAVSIAKINRGVKIILDIKTPSSLEDKRNVYQNLLDLWPGCEVKFVISDYDDYCFAKRVCDEHDLYHRTHVLFSPVVARLNPQSLVDWIMRDKLKVRFQLQLHRVLYGEEPGR